MTISDVSHPAKAGLDTAIGVVGMSTPAWLNVMEGYAQHFVIIGGAILVFLRIMVVLVELMQPRLPRYRHDDEGH